MELVSDLEVHSKYARAVSQMMIIPEMAKWASRKGIDILGTGDFTHPVWLAELKQYIVEDDSGLLTLKDSSQNPHLRFILTGEVSLIYSQGGAGRRVHMILVAPSFEVATAINEKLAHSGTLSSDGRPVLGLSAKWLLEYILEINQKFSLIDDPAATDYVNRPGAFIIPAHVWTPWFGLYGSKSGFDSLEECFEELAPHVRSVETGLSSDIPMNWRLSANDKVALVSFSDAHSAPNLMREATVVEVEEKSYAALAQALQNPYSRHPERSEGSPTDVGHSNKLRDSSAMPQNDNCIKYTLEFFPEEGKYHYDGIANQNLRLSPEERKELEKTDPAKAKKVTIGVMSRVDELADRPVGYQAPNRPGSISVIPLQEIIADLRGVSKGSKKVQAEYEQLVSQASEFDILIRFPESELKQKVGNQLTDAVLAVRRGEVDIEPGYDGVYGTIKIKKTAYNEEEKQLKLL